jgi:hypothetical protein
MAIRTACYDCPCTGCYGCVDNHDDACYCPEQDTGCHACGCDGCGDCIDDAPGVCGCHDDAPMPTEGP